MTEEAVQRLMGLAREAIRSAVLSETRGGRNYEQDADEDLEALESALREALGASLMVNGLTEAETSLTASVAGLTAGAADARDAARLDWLEKTGDVHVISLGSTWYSRAGFMKPHRRHPSLRAAIDAAMATPNDSKTSNSSATPQEPKP